MCHRFTIRADPKMIATSLHPDLVNHMPVIPQKDLYPLADVPVVRLDQGGEWELVPLRWGLLPFWWKAKTERDKPTSFQRKTFNARSETLHEKPTFREAFKRRRCLIPATQFYEGQPGRAADFRLADSDVMAFAGLWERCRISDEQIVESCTIVTTIANSLVSAFHPRNRMPVILTDDDARQLWMSSDIVEREPLEELFVPIDSEMMHHAETES